MNLYNESSTHFNLNFFFLAAGEGTRFRPHTAQYPKPAIPFLNIPLAYYSLALMEECFLKNSPQSVVVNTFHLPAMIKKLFPSGGLPAEIVNYLSSQSLSPFEVQFSEEVDFIRDSGGGLAYAKNKFRNGSIVCMNLDEVVLPHRPGQINEFMVSHSADNNFATLMTMSHPEAGKTFGAIWVDADQNVRGIGKTPPPGDANLKPLHYIGVQILDQNIFKYLGDGQIKENIFYDGMVKAIAAGEKIKAFELDCSWFEMGNEKDYLHGTLECLSILANPDHSAHPYLAHIVAHYSSFNQDFIENRVLKPKNLILNIKQIEEKAVIGLAVSLRPEQIIKNSVLCTNTNELKVVDKLIM